MRRGFNHMVKVLFLCTGNSCRSIMAEAMLRHYGTGRLTAHSAGSRPAGYVHPLALHALSALKIPFGKLESKSWNAFADQYMDVVITLCDSAASEPCPVFPGTRFRSHWSLPDPASQIGDDTQRAQFALMVAERIRAKVAGLVDVNWRDAPEYVQRKLDFLGEI